MATKEEFVFVLRHIMHAIPARRDWLDPAIEKMAKEILKEELIAEILESENQNGTSSSGPELS